MGEYTEAVRDVERCVERCVEWRIERAEEQIDMELPVLEQPQGAPPVFDESCVQDSRPDASSYTQDQKLIRRTENTSEQKRSVGLDTGRLSIKR